MSLYHFAAADYSATGEGRSLFLLITKAYPSPEDYEVQPKFDVVDGKWHYTEGVLKITKDEIAVRKLKSKISPYFGLCAEPMSKENFMKRFGRYIPEVIKSVIEEPDIQKHPGGFEWFQDFYFNYS